MEDGKLVEVLKALKVYVKTALPSLKAVEIINGSLDEDAVKNFVTTSRVVHIGFIGVSSSNERVGGGTILNAAYGAYISTTGANRLADGLNTLEAVAAAISACGAGDSPGLGVTYTQLPILGNIENLYSREVGTRGMAIFGLAFVVPIVFGTATFGGDLDEWDKVLNLIGLDDTEIPVVLDTENEEILEPAEE